MRQRVQDLVRVGDALFSARYPIMSLWQTIAENFHVMRADFTRIRYFSEEFGSYLMTGRPARCHRDLSNSFSAMLRRDQWFHAQTDNELVNEDRDAKIWLDQASKTMRRHMYDRRANFVRATKEADGDFCAFGNAVITREICDYEHLLYRTWHLRDVAWDENVKQVVDNAHFNWNPTARQLIQKFGKSPLGVSPKVAKMKDEELNQRIKCRRVLLPADEYDLGPKVTRGRPHVSVYVDCDNQHILEETALRTFGCTIPRWASAGSLFGNQYGYSLPVVYGLPDARMQQQMMLSILEASEMATRPPMVVVGEAINGGVNLYAAGLIQVDADYDQRTGAAVEPIALDFNGIRFGAEQMERLDSALDDSFFLNKIRFPEVTKEMTAFETSKVYDEFVRGTLPLFEPVNDEYSAGICDGTFEDLLPLGAFGPVEEMPQILRGRDISWQFDTPITVAAERALTGSYQSMLQTVVEGMQVDPSIKANFDINLAARDAVDGGGAPPKWIRSVEQVKQIQAKEAEQQAAQQAADAVAHGADVATRVAGAAESAGNAAQALQSAGAPL